MKRRVSLGTALFLALAGTTSTAPAQSKFSGAQSKSSGTSDDRYAEGLRLYDQGNYSDAAEAFERHFRATGEARALWNLALAELRGKRSYESLGHLRAYLEMPDATAQNREHAQALIERARREIGHVTISAPRAAEISVDGVVVGHAPLDSAVDVRPDTPHIFGARIGERVMERAIEAPGATSTTVRFELERAPLVPAAVVPKVVTPIAATAAPEPTTDHASRIPHEPLFVTLVLAQSAASATLAGAGAYAWIESTRVAHSDNRGLATGLFAGAALLFGGCVATVTLWPRHRAPSAASVHIAPAAAGLGMNVGGSF